MAGEKEPSQLERISSKVHDAWVEWTKHIQRRVKPVWRERWKKLFVDYDELPEFEKDKDRKFARRIQKVVKKSGVKPRSEMTDAGRKVVKYKSLAKRRVAQKSAAYELGRKAAREFVRMRMRE